MTTETWSGGAGRFNDPNNWSPAGVPQPGDTAVVEAGTVKFRGEAVHGVVFSLQGTSSDNPVVLDLRNTWLDSDLTEPYLGLGGPSYYTDIKVSGVVLSTGDITFSPRYSPGFTTMELRHDSAFVNAGTINTGTTWDVNPSGSNTLFVNAGTVSVSNQTRVNVPVTGGGEFDVQGTPIAGATLEFGDRASADVTVNLVGFNGSLVLDHPAEFLGGIHLNAANYQEEEFIGLPNDNVNSVSFADNKLSLFGADGLIAKLNVIGDYQTSEFGVSSRAGGGTEITYAIPFVPPGAAAAATIDQGGMPAPLLQT